MFIHACGSYIPRRTYRYFFRKCRKSKAIRKCKGLSASCHVRHNACDDVQIILSGTAALEGACLVLAGPLFSGKSVFRPVRLHIREGMLAPVIIAGFPAAVRFLCDFLCPMAVNRVMLRFGSISGLAALSIQDAAHYIPLALSEGIASAVILLTSTFAAEYDRAALKRERKIILRFSAAEGSLWALVIVAAAPLLVMLFAKDAPLRSVGVFALRRYLPGVPFICLNMAAASYMQGMGRQKEAGIILLINKDHTLLIRIQMILNDRRHIRRSEAESVLQVMVTLRQASLFLHSENSGRRNSPVRLKVGPHLLVGKVFTVNIPHDLIV